MYATKVPKNTYFSKVAKEDAVLLRVSIVRTIRLLCCSFTKLQQYTYLGLQIQ